MTFQIRFTARAMRSLARIVEFSAASSESEAGAVVGLITTAVRPLASHPFIGRPAEAGLRELVISHGRTGYLALYSVDPTKRVVSILALRHQREAGFSL